MTTFSALLNNAALLIAQVVVLDLATSHYRLKAWWPQIVTGATLGVMGIGLMLAPLVLQPGIIFDTRSVLLCLSGLFFGPLPTAIAMLMTASYRLSQGGAAAVAGALVILASGCIGIFWRHQHKKPLETIDWRSLYVLGLIVHVVMLAMMLTLPWETAQNVLSNIGGPVIVIYPLATAALGLLLAHRLERQKGISALRDSEELKRAILDSVSSHIAVLNREGVIVAVNAPWRRFALENSNEPGKPAKNTDIGVNYLAICRARFDSTCQEAQKAHDGILMVLEGYLPDFTLEYPCLLPTQQRWFTMTVTPLRVENLGVVITHTDITERKLAEETLLESESRFRETFNAVSDAIFIHDAETGHVIDVNRRMCEMWGCTREEALAASIDGLGEGSPPYSAVEASEKLRLARTEGPQIFDWLARASDGRLFWVEVSLRLASIGTQKRILAMVRDITERKEHEKQLMHIAHYDVLTTLPNRVLLADRLQLAMTEAARDNRPLAVAYLDLDGFKTINDKHGHEAGDQLLIALAARMKKTLREGDTLARLGGDEFVAVLRGLPDSESSIPLLTRLLGAASHPTQVGEYALQVSASLGVTFYPQTEEVDADQLLRQADQAMYQAKLAGKNRFHFFDTANDRSLREHHESLEHIRRALREREFVLHYQPKVNMCTGAVIGVEALIRWQHPEKGLLSPAAFLPVIEDHPLSIDIGEWVIEAALTQMEHWHAQGLNIRVSVNIGARQLQQMDFTQRLGEILANHPAISPKDLELEVLETSALEDLQQASQVIESCRALGVTLALDDFGTGYSSLTYLKHLSVSTIKIDQSFVRGMLNNPDDIAILRGVLGMATAFHREVIAEGVETVEHGELLLQMGCELAQGYGVARPMPAADLPSWAAAWRPHPTWSNRQACEQDPTTPAMAE
ncbi:PAS domain S-box-containing protein/diguanylate cyclase (GGDEF) domain-containing protein [Formivibrio citricus]|uniref:PAS domain S-box-containing protein/diguanylate cyclase (GGDEF) domain-containing protein n=1 Tax=Formivibrio citricus TaxID=83765 RepID=A0A1I5CLD3_9NEIS|nr:EAL domain-containing protein [Formivibrio citricus]SFN87820.1 PAS domain S-box-containing protein/diguanylate cyclase (GGDEF) domain-containing protein [Formivibrio citricus]